ncbi:hypothetical protein EDB85DRAFT_1899162 [Lactarius pseudohatsudake]|nr:hypothetical protein EDB85DRAFT_1899162 [Lactarius pseudohatsudake]
MGAHEGTPTPVPPFPFAQERCARGHTPPLRRIAPAPSPSLLSAPPLFAWKGACEGNTPSRGAPFAREGAHKKGFPARRKRRARRRDTPPPLPAHARKRGDSAPTASLGTGDASPAARTSHRTARARKGRGQHLRTGYAGPVLTRPAMPVDAGGSVRPAQPLPRRVHLPVYAREEARARGPHASTHAKGHGTRDGATRGNEAKRSRGEVARANSGTPHASRLT